MPHTPKPETNEVQTAQAVDPDAICSRFDANDARLLQLRGASTEQLANILAESVSGEDVISLAYFALGMNWRFRQTQPEELRELIATVILERRGANAKGEARADNAAPSPNQTTTGQPMRLTATPCSGLRVEPDGVHDDVLRGQPKPTAEQLTWVFCYLADLCQSKCQSYGYVLQRMYGFPSKEKVAACGPGLLVTNTINCALESPEVMMAVRECYT